MSTPQVASGRRIHQVTLQNTLQVPDGQGGFTIVPQALASHIWGEIKPATARDLERVVANTVESTVSHLVTVPYVAGVTTRTVLVFHDGATDRQFAISGVDDPQEQHVQLVLACEETKP